MPAAMSTTPRARGRSSHRRARCRCLGGNKEDRATPCCSFNPLRPLFRCPRRHRSRSRSRSKHRQRTPSTVRDAPVAAAAQQQTQEDEPSFFVYAMPNQSGFGATDKHKKNKKYRKPRMPSFGSCFRRRKKERGQAKAAAATVSAPRPALTPISSLLTHTPGSPASEKLQAATTPSVTQPPSPVPTENGSTAVNSPAPTGRQPASARPAKHSTDSMWSPFAPEMQQQQPKQVEVVDVETGDRLSTHELGLIEMLGSSTDNSAESSAKSSLDNVNEPPLPPAKRTVLERDAAAVPMKIKEAPKLWLNSKSAESRARERFSEPLEAAAAEELWPHDVVCSRVHAVMLAETVSCSSS
ncbi:hypothetical protein Zm00014a_042547 [Zea mays]|uniref:Uncharacterized protein n=1 Tax=Zea mays TaxID=4577 RepID=A0A3L6DJK9_MAIZE|nr:hypothetical protein Zm00014a_042547 [Zea mays]